MMSISTEQQIELDKFPEALRALVEAELAAGNSIVEVGHSFPAPPVGAYIKLANKVSTRTRASGNGLDFYERNSAIYSGEFTDAKRFYFVIEPPNPPPPEPDMDAIRRSHAPNSDSLTYIAMSHAADIASTIDINQASELTNEREINGDSLVTQALSVEQATTGSTRLLHFRDKRPPHEIQFALEREIRALFTPTMVHDKLCLRARATVVGADYDFELRFEAAFPSYNCYSLHMQVSWSQQSAEYCDYYNKTSGSWFELWTREFKAADPPLANAGALQLYHQLCDKALTAENQLDSIPAIQQAIIVAVKRGATFRASHKEGGTNIYWKSNHFVRSDYGDYPDEQQFTDDMEFLTMLRKFCHWDVTRNSGKDQLSDIAMWRLILRRMHSN